MYSRIVMTHTAFDLFTASRTLPNVSTLQLSKYTTYIQCVCVCMCDAYICNIIIIIIPSQPVSVPFFHFTSYHQHNEKFILSKASFHYNKHYYILLPLCCYTIFIFRCAGSRCLPNTKYSSFAVFYTFCNNTFFPCESKSYS